MSSDVHFTRTLAVLGVLGGVAIAFGIPLILLVFGPHLAASAVITLSIIAIVFGAVLAVASAVVGITIPTVVRDGRLDVGRLSEEAVRCCRTEPGGPRDEPERTSP